jgi:flagellar protein FliO/FliZ
MKGVTPVQGHLPSVMNIRSLLRALSVAVMCGLLIPAAAFAADGEKTPLNLPSAQKTADAAAPGASGGLVRTIVGLAIVLAVIYGLYWVLKQVKASREATATGSGLKTVATLPLGTNRSLHLVRAGDEVHLLAAGEGGVSQIRTYREHEARALGLLGDDAPTATVMSDGSAAPLRKLLDNIRNKTVIK